MAISRPALWIVPLATLAVATACFAVWYVAAPLPLMAPPTTAQNAGKERAPAPRPVPEYTGVEQAFGRTADRSGEFCDYGVERKDGMRFIRRIEWFKSRSKATREMQDSIARADQVLERGPSCHTSVDGGGERVVMTSRYPPETTVWSVVMWRQGKDLYSLLSKGSVDDVKAFETNWFPCSDTGEPKEE